MRAIMGSSFSKQLLDISSEMITLPPTSTNQYSINTEDPVSFIPNDIVTDIFGNSSTYTDVENF